MDIVFASGFGPEQTLTDSSSAFSYGRWLLFIVGAVVALVVHLTKATARPVANVATAGIAAPVLSVGEDATSLALSLAAILAPVIALVLLAFTVFGLACLVTRRRRRGERKRLEAMDF
ncbi:hypothetical protein BSZ39_07630 [Bowdeniella nasicola]|uniref:DUF4126 domain-containing protein n=1 Tax=Bowdeniella nasicola TaxID=208480 RepID=A0A1Q5Q1Y5_9ACTO|nr:DUF4126 domain-containing protein [Bowdeniella nasicola]OKL53786.1 hypothetical protein BSZ39_07630 [Bowdeniella nasicola]